MNQGVIDGLIETERRCGMKLIVEKPVGMRISRQPSPIEILIDKKTTGECSISTVWIA
jgi:hypothetical protein